MVLVEAFRLVINSQTAIHKDIHRSLVRTALETVAITLRSNLVERKETVLIRDTVLDDNAHIITKTTFLFVEYIPSVVRVCPSTTAIEIVVVAYGEFRSKTVGITFVLVTVQVRVTVDDLVVGCEILHLQTRITVLVEVTQLDDIVVSILRAVENIRS